MKLRKADTVIVITGRDKGKTGKITAVLPQTNQVVVENINVVKRHTKPNDKKPRGGILEITKPINISKVMALDPTSNKPARIGYVIKADGTKERVFKVSANHEKVAKKAESKKAEKAPKAAPKKAESKPDEAGKK